MKSHACRLSIIVVAVVLAGCGSKSSSTPPPPSAPSPSPQPGALIDNPPMKVATYTPSDLLTLLGGSDLGKTLLQLAYTPECTITVYHLTYQTQDPTGNITPASGALMVPSSGSDTGCTGARPIVLYAHGTTTDKNFNLAQLEAADSAEGVVLAAVFAAEGYIVVAPNYLGYDISTLGYHPYLIAAQQSKEMIDALTAARAALPTADAPGSTDGGKLFITGYSEGGYVAMATHSAMQSAGMTVTASAPMSGPYTLSAFGDAIFEGMVNDSATVNVALLIPAYQNVYGDIYSTPDEVFEGKYATTIPGLLPSTTPVSALQSQGELPSALFSSTPPAPSYAIFTPATSPASLASVFAAGFGTDYLITNTYRASYLADARMQPDGGFPTVTDGLPPANPGNTLRIQFKVNDLRNWTPTAPTLLCGGDSDPTVFFFNTTLMENYWVGHPPAVAPVILDIDSAPGPDDPYASLQAAFAAAKGLVAAEGGESAVLAAYHATLVPPFCLSAVKSFFDAH